MLVSNNIKDYFLLDSGDKLKLESWNKITLIRPDPMAIWPKSKPALWEKVDGIYHRSNKGGGSWQFNSKLPDFWLVHYKDMQFKVSPTNFKHTGIFPEQACNWDFISSFIDRSDMKVLNLFAYTGIATMVASKALANEVVHVDASKGMIMWAKENQKLNKLDDHKIRYIVDDCLKFMQKEIRRNRKYNLIIMDPPSYGKGPNNEIFKFEDKINPLLDAAFQLLEDEHACLILNTYTTGYSFSVMSNLIKHYALKYRKNGFIESDEIGIKVSDSDTVLPCGFTTRWYKR